jgi:hypothetical protein
MVRASNDAVAYSREQQLYMRLSGKGKTRKLRELSSSSSASRGCLPRALSLVHPLLVTVCDVVFVSCPGWYSVCSDVTASCTAAMLEHSAE